MTRKKEISADDLKAILKLGKALADLPLIEIPFDSDDASTDRWDSLPSLSSVLEKRTTPKAAMQPISGTHPICIRVPARVIRAYKLRAEKTGCSYQTLMNRALAAGANA